MHHAMAGKSKNDAQQQSCVTKCKFEPCHAYAATCSHERILSPSEAVCLLHHVLKIQKLISKGLEAAHLEPQLAHGLCISLVEHLGLGQVTVLPIALVVVLVDGTWNRIHMQELF